MSITVIDAVARIRPDMGDTVGSLGLVSRGLMLLPLAAVGAAAALVKMGMDAQTQLSIVAGLTGSSSKQMQYYTSSLESMGAKFGMTLDESAKGLYYVVSAGYSGKDAIDVLTAAMLHAAATGVPLKDVANGLTSAMNAYGASASQASRYSDILTTAITYGKQTTADFANNVSKAALMAASAHVPFTQLAAAEAALTEKGEPANRAFTELSFMISKIAVPSADAMAASVEKLGGHLDATAYQGADLMGKLELLRNSTGLSEDAFLKLVGGTRSARGALGLLSDGGAAYDKILQQMANDSGATAAAFEIHTHTMGFAFDRVKASISNAGYALVQMISPAAIDFLGKIADAAGKLPDLFTTIGNLVGPAFATLGDKTVAAGVGMETFKKHTGDATDTLTTHQGVVSQIATYYTSTYGPAIQKVADFVTNQLVPAFKKFADFVLTQVVPTLQSLVKWFTQNILPILLQFASFILNNVVPAVEQMWRWFSTKVLPILQQVALIILQNVVPALEGIWTTVQTQLVPALENLWNKLSPVLIPVFQALGWLLQHIVGPAIQLVINVLSGVITIIGNVGGGVIGAIGGLLGAIGNVGGGLIGAIGNLLGAIGNAGGGLLGGLGNLRDSLDKDLPPAFQTAGGAVGGFLGHLGDLIGKIGDALGALGNLKDALNSFSGGGGILQGPLSPFKGHAQGGMASGLSLVGEQGPELAVFPPGTNILPAATTRAILNGSTPSGGGSGGGITGGTVVIQIGGTRVAQLLWPELVAALRHSGAIRQ